MLIYHWEAKCWCTTERGWGLLLVGGDYRHINLVDQLFGSETATAQLRCGVHRPRCDDDASPVDWSPTYVRCGKELALSDLPIVFTRAWGHTVGRRMWVWIWRTAWGLFMAQRLGSNPLFFSFNSDETSWEFNELKGWGGAAEYRLWTWIGYATRSGPKMA